MKKIVVCAICLCFIFACSKRHPVKMWMVEPSYRLVLETYPTIEMVQTVNIGEVIARADRYTVSSLSQIALIDPLESSLAHGHEMFQFPGSTFRLFVSTDHDFIIGCRFEVTKPNRGRPADACVVDTNKDGYIDATMFRRYDKRFFERLGFIEDDEEKGPFFPLSKPVKYEMVPHLTEKSDDVFTRKLIFNGYSGGVLRVGYREFSKGLARQAFYEEYTVNISSSDTTRITIRGVDISFQQDGSSGLTYVVHQNFQSS